MTRRIGAICVGFVHHCFYEVFDQLGPQLRWWAWNGDNPLNHPMLSSVPMTSVYIFATLGPAVLTFLVLLLTRLSSIWRTFAAGLLVPIGVALLSIPSSVFGGEHPKVMAQAVVFSLELAVFAVLAVLWVTSDGTPVGNLSYAAVCFVLAALCLTAAMTAISPRSVTATLAV